MIKTMLSELLGSGLRAKLIGWMFTHPDEAYFVRQLESLLHEDSTNLSRELARLERQGILACETKGRQKHYIANAKCPIFGELRSIAAKTSGLCDVLRELLGALGKGVSIAFVYGSQAAQTAKAASDVDLMVIGNASFRQVVASLQPAQDRLGREVNPTVYTKDEFRKKLSAGHQFLSRVMDGPKLFLLGDEHELGKLAKERLAG